MRKSTCFAEENPADSVNARCDRCYFIAESSTVFFKTTVPFRIGCNFILRNLNLLKGYIPAGSIYYCRPDGHALLIFRHLPPSASEMVHLRSTRPGGILRECRQGSLPSARAGCDPSAGPKISSFQQQHHLHRAGGRWMAALTRADVGSALAINSIKIPCERRNPINLLAPGQQHGFVGKESGPQGF